MKVILYMAQSFDGYIATSDFSTNFVSNREWESFIDAINRAGNLITGRTTYESMVKRQELKFLDEIKLVAVTTTGVKTSSPNHAVVDSPEKALGVLKKAGFKEALISAGPQLNSSLMRNNLIDEVYIDIEPIILGKGIKLFVDEYLGKKLEVIDEKWISSNEKQLHYKVIK